MQLLDAWNLLNQQAKLANLINLNLTLIVYFAYFFCLLYQGKLNFQHRLKDLKHIHTYFKTDNIETIKEFILFFYNSHVSYVFYYFLIILKLLFMISLRVRKFVDSIAVAVHCKDAIVQTKPRCLSSQSLGGGSREGGGKKHKITTFSSRRWLQNLVCLFPFFS